MENNSVAHHIENELRRWGFASHYLVATAFSLTDEQVEAAIKQVEDRAGQKLERRHGGAMTLYRWPK